MNEPMHDLLTEEGRHWRRNLGPDPDLHTMLADSRPRRQVIPAMLATAAVIVAIAVAVSVIAIHRGRHPTVMATHGTACQDDFTAAPTRFTPSGTDQDVALRLTYQGAQACVIDGHGPHVDLLDAAGKSLGQAMDTSLVGTTDLTVDHGDVVALTMSLGGICPQVDQRITALRAHMDGNLNTGTAGIMIPVPGANVTSCPSASQPPGVIAGFQFPKIVKRDPSAQSPTPTTPSPTTSATECPRRAPRISGPLPSDGQPLFARPVAEMIACKYSGRQQSRLVAAVPLSRRLATQLAQHLNHAGTSSNDPLQCLVIPNISVLLARDIHGSPLAPITLIPGCRQIAASNGSTTRYLETFDPAFRQANRYVSSHS